MAPSACLMIGQALPNANTMSQCVSVKAMTQALIKEQSIKIALYILFCTGRLTHVTLLQFAVPDAIPSEIAAQAIVSQSTMTL